MNSRLRLIPRIALFSALIYVLSWGTSYLPNVNLVFFIAFMAGAFWGLIPGVLVGAIGMGLWTTFHPFGPAMPPIMIAQVIGTAFSGAIGAVFSKKEWYKLSGRILMSTLVVLSVACTILFYLPVNLVDAWMFRPFWPRFIGGMVWSLISLCSNAIIFPVLFRPVWYMYNRERLV